jgi:hypothetical protein
VGGFALERLVLGESKGVLPPMLPLNTAEDKWTKQDTIPLPVVSSPLFAFSKVH